MNEFYIQSATPKQGCRRKCCVEKASRQRVPKSRQIPCKTCDITGQNGSARQS